MKLAGFQYTKILGEKYSQNFEGLKIDSSLNIDSIEESEVKPSNKELIFLEVDFTSTVTYSKKIAKIELGGKMVLSIDSKEGKEALKSWKKKKLEGDFKKTIFNIILAKTSIKELGIEEDLNLPPHFRLPQINS